MRLNRVLLLAATINILIFALVFTISCSGEDGKRGAAGKGCELRPTTNGYDIWCDGDDEAVGSIGGTGPKGQDGTNGENCWLGPITSEGYQVLCGTGNGTPKGYLAGCSIVAVNDSKYESIMTCGKFDIYLCGAQSFEPSEQTCNPATGALTSGATITYGKCGKEKVPYNTAKEYCGYAEGDDPDEDPTTPYKKCPTDDNSQPNADAWNDEYCRYTEKEKAVVAGSGAEDFCNGEKYNKDNWLFQYCGWNKENVKKSVQTGACDEATEGYQGPNQRSYAEGYCEVTFANKTTGKTVYSEKKCGTSANNRINKDKWQNQYCGYANENSEEATKVWGGIGSPEGLCDNSTAEDIKAPHLKGFNDGYCGVEWVAGIKIGTGKTVFLDKEKICDDGGKPNEGEWKGQYCGAASSQGKATKLYDGICDNGEGPNEDGWNPNEYCGVTAANKTSTIKMEAPCDNKDKINEGGWKREYCGYASKTAKGTSKQDGACNDGTGPNDDEFGSGYCWVEFDDVLKDGEKQKGDTNTVKSTTYCGEGATAKKYNEGTWKNEYCGFSSAANKTNGVESVLTGVCGDGEGPWADDYDKAYCEWRKETDTYSQVTEYSCAVNETTGKGTKMNENTWQGQFCTADKKAVKSCTGGQVPIPSATTANNNTVFCANPSQIAFCKAASAEYKSNKMCNYPVSSGAASFKCDKSNSDIGKYIMDDKDAVFMVECKYSVTSKTACPTANSTPSGFTPSDPGTPSGAGICVAEQTSTKCTAATTASPAGLGGTIQDKGVCQFTPGLTYPSGGGGEPAVTYDLQCPTGIGSVSAETGDDKSAIEPEVICKPSNAAGVAVASDNLSWTAVKDGASDPVALVWNPVEEGVFTTITAKATSGNCNNKTVVCSGTLTVTDP